MYTQTRDRYIFDVDGTLTPSRGTIDSEFAEWFVNFCNTHLVYLVTGSDRAKTLEQLGETVYNACARVYQCSGSVVYIKDCRVQTLDWSINETAHQWLENELKRSEFPLRTGNHIEARPGMVNFSIVGRNCTLGERKLYVRWDQEHNERNSIADRFNADFPGITARVGGETGIDIFPTGCDKSQILRDFVGNERVIFFGDAMHEQGNDYPLAAANTAGTNHAVQNWQHTWEILREYDK